MRCFIMVREGEASKFKKPPYIKGLIVSHDPPKALKLRFFSDVFRRFNNLVEDDDKIDRYFLDFRNLLAHGLIAEINNDGKTLIMKLEDPQKSSFWRFEVYEELNQKWISENAKRINEEKKRIVKMFSNLQKVNE